MNSAQMVCKDCEKKQVGIHHSDPFASKARNVHSDASGSGGSTSRKVGGNMLLTKKGRDRHNPYTATCKVCKQSLHQGGLYCMVCANHKGVCALCGKMVTDMSFYRQSAHELKGEKESKDGEDAEATDDAPPAADEEKKKKKKKKAAVAVVAAKVDPAKVVSDAPADDREPLPAAPWAANYDASGNLYFYNSENQQTCWAFACWQAAQDSAGSTYYYNTLTSATSWVKPSQDGRRPEGWAKRPEGTEGQVEGASLEEKKAEAQGSETGDAKEATAVAAGEDQ